MAALRAGRAQRVKTMAARLKALGFRIDLDAVHRVFRRASLSRRHLADFLARTQQVANPREVFTRYLGDKRSACVDKPRLDTSQAIALIQRAGGVAALAHPPHDLRESAIRAFAGEGLRAIEVDGPGFSNGKSRRLRTKADRLGLTGIAGSDFHAPRRPGTAPPRKAAQPDWDSAAESAGSRR